MEVRLAPALALHPKSLRQIGNPWFSGTNARGVYEPLMWEVRFLRERGGDRSIGKANLRKGHQPLQWPARLVPVRGVSPFYGSGTAAPFNGSAPRTRSRAPLRGTPATHLNAPLACFLAYVKYASIRRFACAPFLAPKVLRQIGEAGFF